MTLVDLGAEFSFLQNMRARGLPDPPFSGHGPRDAKQKETGIVAFALELLHRLRICGLRVWVILMSFYVLFDNLRRRRPDNVAPNG